MVEGTPLLRAHLGKTWIEGSNPSFSAKYQEIRQRELSLKLAYQTAEAHFHKGFRQNLLTSHGSDDSGLHRPEEVYCVPVLKKSILKLSLVQTFLPRLVNCRDLYERLVTACICALR